MTTTPLADIDDIFEKIAALLRDLADKERHHLRLARTLLDTERRQRREEAAVLREISNAVDPETGKRAFSNEQMRRAELDRRMQASDIYREIASLASEKEELEVEIRIVDRALRRFYAILDTHNARCFSRPLEIRASMSIPGVEDQNERPGPP